MNEEKFKKYLRIANNDIQMANDTMELKSYVASILYEIDNLQSKIDKAIEYIENNLEVNEYNDYVVYLGKNEDELLDILNGGDDND